MRCSASTVVAVADIGIFAKHAGMGDADAESSSVPVIDTVSPTGMLAFVQVRTVRDALNVHDGPPWAESEPATIFSGEGSDTVNTTLSAEAAPALDTDAEKTAVPPAYICALTAFPGLTTPAFTTKSGNMQMFWLHCTSFGTQRSVAGLNASHSCLVAVRVQFATV